VNVREYWTVLREDRWLVGSVLVVCVVIAAAVAVLLPRTYTSTAIFYVASPQSTTSSTDSYAGSQLSTERVKSYSELLTGPRVAADASALLGGTPSAAEIQRSVSADSVAETVVLNLGVTEPTPQDAQLVGTAVATSFTRLVNSIESTGQPVNRPIVSTELIYPPTLPTFPAGPGTTMLLAAGLLAGLVLGVGAALGRRAVRRAVDTPDALETALEAPVLTALPGLPQRPDRPALFLEPAPGRRGRRAARARDRAAAVRRLRTAVVADAGGRRCLVISGVRAEQGTTTVAVDLAVALALAGESVLLVDADLRRPALARRLDLDGARGLASVLDGAGWDGAVQRWTTGGLDVLPAGPGVDRPGEAWGTAAASSALSSLRESYTWVLLDASPVASSSESVDLARLADGVVLVARRGSARPEDLDAAAAGLRTVGAPVIGSVFTFAVDVPAAPAEAPRALPPGRSGAPAEATAAPATESPAPAVGAGGSTDEAVGAVGATTELATVAVAEPTVAEPTTNAAAATASAPEAGVERARQNGAAPDAGATTATPRRRTSTRTTAPVAPAASSTPDTPADEAPAKPATRTRKTRAGQGTTSAKSVADEQASAPAANPARADEAAATEKAAPTEKPTRKPRDTRRTAVTTPTDPTPEPVTTSAAASTSPAPAAHAAGTAPADTTASEEQATAADSTSPSTTSPGGTSTDGTSTDGTSTGGTVENDTTPTTDAAVSSDATAAESPSSGTENPPSAAEATPSSATETSPSESTATNGTRTRRATRSTSPTASPSEATTTVEGAEKPARTRATRTRTATNGHTPRPEATDDPARPTRTRGSSRTTPTGTPTSGS
jgi:Mrp family chromosome partitioning ATPase